MRVVFLGTPDFGIPSLENLLNSKHDLIAIVSQPDRINARNKKVVFSPVKQFAIDNNIPLYQFEKISRDGVNILKELNADIMVTAAYGQILSEEILSICRYGVINIHASILPKHRGSSPIQSALLNGDEEIGVTIMQTDFEVDSGDIIRIKKYKLNGDENAEDCFNILSKLGANALIESLNDIESGIAVFTPQDHSKATYTTKIKKEDGQINLNNSSHKILNQIRAFSPWPTAYVFTSRERIIIHKASLYKNTVRAPIGMVVDSQNKLIVQCKDALISFDEVQGEGSKCMDIASYLRGKPLEEGEIIKYLLSSE